MPVVHKQTFTDSNPSINQGYICTTAINIIYYKLYFGTSGFRQALS